MIAGIGIDVVEVARICAAMDNPRFVGRILTPAERESCTSEASVAGRWAAKEAIAKAVAMRLSWQDVEILNNEVGAPVARVRGLPPEARLHVSITHERNYAAAMAVLEK